MGSASVAACRPPAKRAEQGSPASRGRATMAVCIVGASGMLSHTAASVGKLLRGRAYSVFAVTNQKDQSEGSAGSRGVERLAATLNATFGGRLRTLQGESAYEPKVMRSIRNSPCWQTVGVSKWRTAQEGSTRLVRARVAQLAQRDACWRMVRREEKASGRRFSAYARIRTNHEFFSQELSLPEHLSAKMAYIPEGEDWGQDLADRGTSDVMLFGGEQPRVKSRSHAGLLIDCFTVAPA